MATTTVLNSTHPSSVFSTPDFLLPLSKPMQSPLLPSTSAQPSPSFKSSLLFDKPDHDPPQARPPPTNQAKLHKRISAKSSRSSQADRQRSATDPAYSATLTKDTSSHEQAPFSRSVKLKHNLRKLTTQPNDDPTAIDLSKTAQENEQRSGIAIQSQSQTTSPASPFYNDTRTTGARHVRSFSAASVQSASTTTFTPTLPYVHPMRQQEKRPHRTSTSQTFQPGSILGNDYSADEDSYGLGINTMPSNASVTGTAATARSSADQKRISTHGAASELSTAAQSMRFVSNPSQSQSQANLSYSSSYTSCGLPTSTAQPHSTATLPSATSNTHPRSKRSITLSSPPITAVPPSSSSRHSGISTDNTTAFSLMHASTVPANSASTALITTDESAIHAIHAARQAFTERQEAKSRKYEKAAQKAEEKKGRRSSNATAKSVAGSASSPRSKRASKEKPRKSDGASASRKLISKSYTDLLASEEADGTISAGAMSAALIAGAGGTSPRSTPTPKISRKRKAKSGYLGFWTWFRVKMMRLEIGK